MSSLFVHTQLDQIVRDTAAEMYCLEHAKHRTSRQNSLSDALPWLGPLCSLVVFTLVPVGLIWAIYSELTQHGLTSSLEYASAPVRAPQQTHTICGHFSMDPERATGGGSFDAATVALACVMTAVFALCLN